MRLAVRTLACLGLVLLATTAVLAGDRVPTPPQPTPLPLMPALGDAARRGEVLSKAIGDTFYFGGTQWDAVDQRWEAIPGGTWTFDSGVATDYDFSDPEVDPYKDPSLQAHMEGWVGVDLTRNSGLPAWQRLSPGDFGAVNCVGSAVGLGGNYSLYAGLTQAQADSACYLGGQGYENGMWSVVAKTFNYSSVGEVTVEFDYRVEAEPHEGSPYDYLYIGYGDGSGNLVADLFVSSVVPVTLTGVEAGTLTVPFTPSIPVGPLTIFIMAFSDGVWSDEDGWPDTACGLAAIDDIVVTGPGISDSSDFETGMDGWTSWSTAGPGGDHSQLVDADVLDPSGTSCLDGNVLTFAGPGENLPGGPGGYPDGRWNLAMSPWIDLAQAGVAGETDYFVEFDIQGRMPQIEGAYYQVMVQYYPEICSVTGQPMESAWAPFDSWYWLGDTELCGRARFPFSDIIPPTAERVRIYLGVTRRLLCQAFPSLQCDTFNYGPRFDNVRFGATTAQCDQRCISIVNCTPDTEVAPGQEIETTFTVSNCGSLPTIVDWSRSTSAKSGGSPISWGGSTGACDPSTGQVALDPGESAQVSITCSIPADALVGDEYKVYFNASTAISCDLYDQCQVTYTVGGDCDGNSLLDTSEIAGNPNLDCNGNGLLDSCESSGVYPLGQLPNDLSYGVSTNGSYAFVCNPNSNLLQVVDVSDPTAPVIVGSTSIPGRPYDSMRVDNYLYVAAYDIGLYILDISSLGPGINPPMVGTMLPTTHIVDIERSGNWLYLATESGGLRFVSIATRTNPATYSSFGIANARAVAVNSTVEYVAAGLEGLKVVSTFYGFQFPFLAGQVDTPDYASDIARLGTTYVVVADMSSVQIIQTNVVPPVIVASIPGLTGASRVTVDGNLAYIGTTDGVLLYDLSNPLAPVLVSQAFTPAPAYTTVRIGNVLVNANSTNGVVVLNTIALDSDGDGWLDVCGPPPTSVPVANRPYKLYPAIPNPFNPSTTIRFELARDEQVELTIFDVAGRRVRTLLSEQRPAGLNEVIWRGLDDGGKRVASGVYLYRMDVGGKIETRRMTLLK